MTRALTHVVVIGVVALAAILSYGATRPIVSAESAASLSFDVVARARAVNSAATTPRRTTFDLEPNPTRHVALSRRVLHAAATTLAAALPTPLPTPVAPPSPALDALGVGSVAGAPQASTIQPGAVVGTGVLGWPIRSFTITTYFSAWHQAIDLAAPYGTPVIAADSGVVTWAGWRNNGGGLVVEIDHANGIRTVYNHLGTILVGPGQAVSKGQQIAGVGCTGMCTGPHVHFEVIVGGVFANPLRYLPAS